MMAAISSPWVVRLSIRALTSPWRSSFSTSAPAIRTASPSTFRALIRRPRRVPGSQRNRERLRSRGWSSRDLGSRDGGFRDFALRLGFAVAVPDAIEGFDRVEFRVNVAELLAHAL